MEERFTRLRGFIDIYGDDLYFFEFLENTFRKYAEVYGFVEIKTPILEKTDLFVRGIGEGSDIVRKEMFSFEDRGGRNVTMRPEGTASVVRAFLENNLVNDPKYYKLFYSGPMFRAERPQAGRLRQFHQLGVEWFGSDNPIVDFETISMLWDIIVELGIHSNVDLIINSVGCDKCIPNYKENLKVFFDSNYDKFCDDCKDRRNRNILRVFDCKNHSCQRTLEDAPKVLDYLCDDCRYHFDTLQNLLSKKRIPFVVEDSLVRGLDYYTRNVFEVRYRGIGSQNAIAGGGRYNKLVKEFGGPDIPAFGFAMGVERTILAIKDKVKPINKVSVGVCNVSDNELDYAIKVANYLRGKGIITHLFSYVGNFGKQMKMANRFGVNFVVILGEDEVRKDVISVKNMETGEQKQINLEEVFLLIAEVRHG